MHSRMTETGRLAAVLSLLIVCGPPLHAEDRHFKQTYTRTVDLNYRVYLPDGYADDASKRWPLILFLHGAGERGDDLDILERTGLPKLLKEGRRLPFVIVAPQCPAGGWWRPDPLVELLDHVIAEYRVDSKRVYLTGLSMGGTGTWMLAAEYPERFAAIAPISGRSLPLRAEPLRSLPVWVFHGDADPVVDFKFSEVQVEKLKAAGNERVKFTRYEGAGHGVWDQTYADPGLYEWFLSHHIGG